MVVVLQFVLSTLTTCNESISKPEYGTIGISL